MEIIFKDKALKDILYWKKSGDKGIQTKISNLLEDIAKTPFKGIGKPEPLKYELSGLWSRKIDREHRIIYEVVADNVYILSLKGHYE